MYDLDKLFYINKEYDLCTEIPFKNGKLTQFDTELKPAEALQYLSSEQLKRIIELTGHVRSISHASKTIASRISDFDDEEAYNEFVTKMYEKMYSHSVGFDVLQKGKYDYLTLTSEREVIVDTKRNMKFEEIPEIQAIMGGVNREHLRLKMRKSDLAQADTGHVLEHLKTITACFNDPTGQHRAVGDVPGSTTLYPNAKMINLFCANEVGVKLGITFFTYILLPVLNQHLIKLLYPISIDDDNEHIRKTKKIIKQLNLLFQHIEQFASGCSDRSQQANARRLLSELKKIREIQKSVTNDSIKSRIDALNATLDDLDLDKVNFNQLFQIENDILNLSDRIKSIREAKLIDDKQFQSHMNRINSLKNKYKHVFELKKKSTEKKLKEIQDDFNDKMTKSFEEYQEKIKSDFNLIKDSTKFNSEVGLQLLQKHIKLLEEMKQQLSDAKSEYRADLNACRLALIGETISDSTPSDYQIEFIQNISDKLDTIADQWDARIERELPVVKKKAKGFQAHILLSTLNYLMNERFETEMTNQFKDIDKTLASIESPNLGTLLQTRTTHITAFDALKTCIASEVCDHQQLMRALAQLDELIENVDTDQENLESLSAQVSTASTRKLELINGKIASVIANSDANQKQAQKLKTKYGVLLSDKQDDLTVIEECKRQRLARADAYKKELCDSIHASVIDFRSAVADEDKNYKLLIESMAQYRKELEAKASTYDVQLERMRSLKSSIPDGFPQHEWLLAMTTEIASFHESANAQQKAELGSVLKIVNDVIDPAIAENKKPYAALRLKAENFCNRDSQSYNKIGNIMLAIGIFSLLLASAALVIVLTGGLGTILVAGWMFTALYAGAGAVAGEGLVSTIVGSFNLFKAKQPVLYQSMMKLANTNLV